MRTPDVRFAPIIGHCKPIAKYLKADVDVFPLEWLLGMKLGNDRFRKRLVQIGHSFNPVARLHREQRIAGLKPVSPYILVAKLTPV